MLTFFILVSYGVAEIILFIQKKFKSKLIAAAFIFLIFFYPLAIQAYMYIMLYTEGPNENYKYIGEWIRNNTPSDNKIASVEIGNIGWYSDRYIIDILGLVNPLNAEFVGRNDFSKWFEYYKPDYILIHELDWPQENGIHGPCRERIFFRRYKI